MKPFLFALAIAFAPPALAQEGGHHAPTGHGAHEGQAASHAAPDFDQGAVEGDEARISGLLRSLFETPEAPLSLAPVLIDGDLAVIGWIQEARGGRALLRRDDHGLWRVSLCAGDGLKGEANLIALGVEPEAAQRLAAAQIEAETAMAPEQAALLALFDGELWLDPEGEPHGHGAGED